MGHFMKTDDIATFQKVPTENTSVALPSTTVFRSYSLRGSYFAHKPNNFKIGERERETDRPVQFLLYKVRREDGFHTTQPQCLESAQCRNISSNIIKTPSYHHNRTTIARFY
jgi:hypothetical protein